jgi:hypothetical protein
MPPSVNSPPSAVAHSRSLLDPSRSPDPITAMFEYGAANSAGMNDDFLSDIDDDDDEEVFLLASPGATLSSTSFIATTNG